MTCAWPGRAGHERTGITGSSPPRRAGAVSRRGGWRRIDLDDDEGVMTVTTAFAVAAVLALAVAVLLVGRATVAGHAARAAADLAALAGAHALRAGEDPCAAASGIADANRAELSVCRVDGHDVVARAEVRVDLGVFGARSASAVARAGPV